jgi:hypothetical protein
MNDAEASLLLPDVLFPARYQLRWGITLRDASAVLGIGPRAYDSYRIIKEDKEKEPYRVDFMFDDSGLYCIQTVLQASRWFEDAELQEVVEGALEAFHVEYDRLVARYRTVLGDPNFQGTMSEGGFPDYIESLRATYWDTPFARFVVSLEQQAYDVPITISISCLKQSD